MTPLRSTSTTDAAISNDSGAPDPTPSTSRSLMVGAHLVLLSLAVIVVWAATGRGSGTLADASVATALSSEPTPINETIADASSASLIPTPHAVAAPLPVTQTQAQFTQPATPAAMSQASPPVPAFNPMVALPEPGAAFPPVMPADPRDDPHYNFGGLYGTPGATRLVYLIDASGSLIDTLPFILGELQRALSELRPEQSFAVLFFSGENVTEAPPYGMKRATTQAVRHTSQWVDPGSGRIIASGRPHADAAIRRALAYQPDAIILLSDGLTDGGERALATRARLLSLIGTANTADVIFHTLQVRRPDPLSTPTRLGTLELIALQSGGVHRYLGEDDLLPE